MIARRTMVVHLLAWALVSAFLWTPAAAQYPTRANMPEEVILVVRVIDEETVEPATGVVIGRSSTNEGLVVVPAAFADAPGDLYVLDGGTNLFRDGLPADRVPLDGDEPLAVVSVEGLRRPAISLTFNFPESDHELRLAAWPTAELMAAGSLPYWTPIGVAATLPGEPQTFATELDIPNVSGPLIDLCGQWAGMVLAGTEPAEDGSVSPRVLLNDELLGIARLMDLRLRVQACEQFAPIGGRVVTTVESPVSRSADDAPESGIMGLLRNADFGLGAIVFLLSAVVAGIVFWVLIQRRAEAQRRKRVKRTMQTETVSFTRTGLPTQHTRAESPPTFQPNTIPQGASDWLRIEGHHADGRPLRAVTSVDSGKFQAVIGRAGVPLAADGPGISRKHAVITGELGRLMISDLGSRNGTYVNGVRCQKDEVFYVKEGDQILLGAAEVTIRLSPGRGSSS